MPSHDKSATAPFSGALTALVTPFRNGAVDEAAYRDLIERQIADGIHGLVPCGTTGESATLSHEEHEQVIKICIDQAKGRVKILAGAGSNNTIEAIRLTKFAKKAGADGALLITPYYNKPTQEGLYQHFKAIAEAVDLPLVPYNVPGRTGCNLLPATLARLAKDFPSIVGVKEATGDLTQGSLIIESCPPNFTVLSGDDFTALPLMAIGGKGVISVTSNVLPGKMAAMVNAANAGDMAGAAAIHHELFPLHQILFAESNPIPVKTALALMGRMTEEMRLPLYALSAPNRERLIEVMKSLHLLPAN
ncbi:MAG: 4-hydroxy-tetrahydrodipicolinate synthase [Desulfovibrio sp.]|jgi:4-hydroxy-tetrahydrodipicolinate synthase|nr:4-hydroxy-tetrahydrodipicolinate synthase [Desulfovibrio sp.]